MTAKLFVGNLPYTVTEEEIEALLNEAGFQRAASEEEEAAQVTSIRIVRDRDTGLSRGFGFVEMATREMAQQARERLLENRAALNGRELVVDLAKPGAGGSRGTGGRR